MRNYQWIAIGLCTLLCGWNTAPVFAADTTATVTYTVQATPTVMRFLVQSAPEYQTLVKGLNGAHLVETLEGAGTFTVFAPVNAAFTALPYGTLDDLLKPENVDSLQKLLSYHILAGSWDTAKLSNAIKEKGGELSLPTIGPGGSLTFFLGGHQVYVRDNHGLRLPLNAGIPCTNGRIFSINKILLP